MARPGKNKCRYVAHDVIEQLPRLTLSRLGDGGENPPVETHSTQLFDVRMACPKLQNGLSITLQRVRRELAAELRQVQLFCAPIGVIVNIEESRKQQPPSEIDLFRIGSAPGFRTGTRADVDDLAAFDGNRVRPPRLRIGRVDVAVGEDEIGASAGSRWVRDENSQTEANKGQQPTTVDQI
jgi:hypothetical protein